MKTMISNLHMDMMEEILSRVPVKSIRAVRTTCKNWNALSKNQSFANKHVEKAAASQREKEVHVITGNNKDYLISVKLYDFHNKNFGISTNSKGKLVTRENSDLVVVHRVFYCNGLLLCLCGHIKRRLLVCNPYWGTRRWIKNPTERCYEMFAFGYDKSCGRHKILRLSKDDDIVIHIDIYDLGSDSWYTPDEAFHSNVIEYTKHGLSLKGNAYLYAYDKESRDGFLHCFDFTRERFGLRLPPPVDLMYGPCFGPFGCNVSLSSTKEEKLALLLKHRYSTVVTVWVTDKIEPDYVSWSKFFQVEMLQKFCNYPFESFLIDEEKKTVVVFDEGHRRNTSAYIIDGENGHFRKVSLNESRYSRLYYLVSNYVPSSLHI